jgi:hypothetical protein
MCRGWVSAGTIHSSLKDDVRRVFALRCYPIMPATSEQVLQQRTDIARIVPQDLRPIQTRKLIRKLLRPLPVINPQENIVVLGEGNPVCRMLSFRPIMPVPVDSYLHGKPGLYFYADQAEFLIHEAEVYKKAFPARGPCHGPPFFKPE